MPTIAGSCLTLDFCLCPHSRRSRLPIIPVVSQIKAKCCWYLYWNPFYMHQCRNWNLMHFCRLGSLPVTIFTYVISGCATLKYAFGAIYRNSNYRNRLCWNESKCGQHSWLMGPNPALEFFQVLWFPPPMGCWACEPVLPVIIIALRRHADCWSFFSYHLCFICGVLLGRAGWGKADTSIFVDLACLECINRKWG